MSCEEVVREIPLYAYGEVSPETEEHVESHLADCAVCRAEMERHRKFLDALDMRPDYSNAVADPALLTSCRAELRAQVDAEARRAAARPWSAHLENWWNDVVDSFRVPINMRVPVGAVAVFALGFLAARYTPQTIGGVSLPGSGSVASASMTPPMFSTVRSVEPQTANGEISIAVDDVARHVVHGKLDDPRIQELLLSAVREEDNPGIRAQSIMMLQNQVSSQEVRQALIEAASHDPSAAIRLKALEGLRQQAANAAVRRMLANVLLMDDNAGVRSGAIDVLSAHHDGPGVQSDDSIVGMLQEVVQQEDDNYVRARVEQLLEAMRASVGTY